MSKQVFTANQILTAAQMNTLQQNDYNQTVSTKTASYTLVAADAGTQIAMNNASATTITVNTSLFTAGDSLTISNIGAGVTTITAGSATVSSAGPLAVPQYGGGRLVFTSASAAIYYPSAVTVAAPAASGLTFITGGSISGSSTSVDNCFSATYLNYKIVLNDLVVSAGARIRMRLRASSADNTTSNYSSAVGGIDTTSSTYTVSIAQQNTTSFAFTTDATVGAGLSTGFDIYSPFDTNATHYGPAAVWQTETILAATSIGVFKQTTSFDGITFFPTSPDTMTGTYKIYGYANS